MWIHVHLHIDTRKLVQVLGGKTTLDTKAASGSEDFGFHQTFARLEEATTS